MTTDISNLYHLVFFVNNSPDSHIGRSTLLKVAMMAIFLEFAITGPVSPERAAEPHLGQQELQGLINSLGQSLEPLSRLDSQ
jgi:hypothetical protein